MIPAPEPNIIGFLIWIGFMLVPIPFLTYTLIKNEKYVIHAMIAFIVIVAISAYMLAVTPSSFEEYEQQVAEEIENSSCTELVENYKAYEDSDIKSQIADEYVIDCVATDEAMMILEALK